ncbi:helix-turn-helix domain-containing protein [Agrobacterium salinitolerans]|uniref:helix-turn-helix domain-containing protein n=1 Tax=Agrobacterium salinitolerans TaxID=1183413 RepID=UPI001573A474|nr:helix-turn-helix transcriptional regulator [Agrobacterium salinitolerans]NTA40315.1 helix-turn-helix transcriptional regulator [Agrobacterium salinitolerans]
MEKVVAIASAKALGKSSIPSKGNTLNQARQRWGLSVAEAASVLEIAIADYASMEHDANIDINLVEAEYKFEEYMERVRSGPHRNLLFSVYPLGFCREIMRLSVDEIAEMMGYSKETWKKFESNHRSLSEDKVRRLERLISEEFKSFCG